MAKKTAKSKPSQGFVDDGAFPYESAKAGRDAANAEARRQRSRTLKATPPRTGPSSSAGGYGARYSRLTSGLMKHGR